MAFAVVGLTGGIGSGKSTVARLFAEAGVPVIDADQVAREIVAPGTEGLAEVAALLGPDVVRGDGTMDRAAVGARVFADADLRRKLEAILHPKIAAASLRHFAALAAQGHPYALYEAALLVEGGRHESMAALIVVAVDDATQVERVRARDGLDVEQARARIASQLPLADKIRVADYVIDNGGGLEATRAQVAQVHAALLAARGEAS